MKTQITLLLLSSSLFFCQENESIQTDRPDQTETAALVPMRMLQVETGFSCQKNNTNSTIICSPSILWKFGLLENFEIRLITEYLIEDEIFDLKKGLSPILIGCKIKIFEENGFLPKTSFIGHFSLPNVASTKFKNEFLAPEFRFAMQHSLSNKFALSYNFGCEWDGDTLNPTIIYTIATGYSITNKMGSYIELYGFLTQNETANHNFDAGFTYLINHNFMLDLSSGFEISNNAPNYYFSLGFSFRI